MTAWLQTPWPELARKCWFCGAPRGQLCVTAGGRISGCSWDYPTWQQYRSHKGRGARRFRTADGHGAYGHCYPHGDTLWERTRHHYLRDVIDPPPRLPS